jgi:competence protein ComEA
VNGIKKTIRNFFGTTRAQTNGFVGLLFVITIAIFSQPLTRWWVSSQPQDFSKDTAVLDSLTRNWKTAEEKQKTETQEEVIAFFAFDPNSATLDELKSLGFSEKLAARIINYRTKGGKFRIKTDLMKLYGMDSLLYEKLIPYIQLPDQFEKPKFEKKEFADRKPKEKPQKFNLNEADTIQLEKIYGIGPALAKRIVKYRDKLGGFVSQDQLKEVYGLDTAVVKKITEASYLSDPPGVKKINLNTADEKILATHPYFGRKIASAIVAYRFQHGNFKSVDDLSRIPLIDKNNLRRLFPYATVDP